jgi:hypothetical protein
MKVTITDAAKMVSLSRSYFHMQYIKPGKISVERDNIGKPWIDTAELLRVFGKLSEPNTENTQQNTHTEHQITAEKHQENMVLQIEVRLLREQLKETRDRESWLQSQVDKLTDTVRLLEHRAEPKRGFWTRLFGR